MQLFIYFICELRRLKFYYGKTLNIEAITNFFKKFLDFVAVLE